MTKISIRILESSVLTTRWEEYYCIEELYNVFDIEYWDCSLITSPSFRPLTEISRKYVTKIGTTDELFRKLKDTPKDALLIVNIHRNPNNYRVHRIVAKFFKNIIYIKFFADNSCETNINPIKKFIYKFYPPHTREIIYWKLYNKLYNVIDFGCTSDCNNYRINHPDFESYLKVLKSAPRLMNGKSYIVYLDNYFPFHPEIIKREWNFNPKSIAKDFYSSINKFFDFIEKKYHCEVIIAAHPSSIYKTNPFNNRSILYNKTNILVYNAKGVVMHTSNSLSYVYLNRIPVALITNQAYQKAKGEYRRLKKLSLINNFKIINTDLYDTDQDIFTNISEEARDKYINYLTDRLNMSNAERFLKYYKDVYKKNACKK